MRPPPVPLLCRLFHRWKWEGNSGVFCCRRCGGIRPFDEKTRKRRLAAR